MDSIDWYRGVNLKRKIEQSGSPLALIHVAVAAVLITREHGLAMEDLIRELQAADRFDEMTGKVDKDKNIRELGF